MTITGKKQKVLIGTIILAVLTVVLFFMPISTGQQPTGDDLGVSNLIPNSNTISTVRYAMAIQIKLWLDTGGCNSIVKAISYMENGKKVLDIQSVSNGATECIQMATVGPHTFKVSALPWQKDFVIKSGDQIIYDGRL